LSLGVSLNETPFIESNLGVQNEALS
jgi:hypothetical protein